MRRQRPVVHHPRFQSGEGGVPRIARQQFLDIVRDHAHWTAARFGQRITNRRVAGIALAAKVAPDKSVMEENLRFRYARRSSQRLSRVVGHLATEPYMHAAVLIINMNQHRLRLQIDLVLPLGHIRLLDDDISRRESRFEIAFFKLSVMKDIGRDFHGLRKAKIGMEVRM